MAKETSINHLAAAFSILLLSAVFVGCTYKHDGKLVKDTEGIIYKLEGSGRTSEAYHLVPIDTVDYESYFK